MGLLHGAMPPYVLLVAFSIITVPHSTLAWESHRNGHPHGWAHHPNRDKVPVATPNAHHAPQDVDRRSGTIPLPPTTITMDSGTQPLPACESVVAHGARGDGVHDDTAAFNTAASAAAASPGGSGCVVVPPVVPVNGTGYVITSTVSLPVGVALIGTVAGLPVVPWCYAAPYDVGSEGGARILARPTGQLAGAPLAPLFHLLPGCTVRGLFILYDRMPFPTDAEFMTQGSPYYYANGFAEAQAKFYTDHVPHIGPTIFIEAGTRVVVEDVVASGYRDLVYFAPGAGQSHVRRVHGWGYGAMVTVSMAADVLSFDTLRYVINAGPHCVGPEPGGGACEASPGAERCRGNFTWLPALVAVHPNNVGLWLARSDGYVASDLFFFGINTAIRLGQSTDFPLLDPTTGKAAPALDAATGPWGAVSRLMVDQCVRGIHLVWPNPLTNRFSLVQIHPSFWSPNDTFVATAGTGTGLDAVGTESAIAVEASHCRANNKNLSAPIMLSHMVVASFADSGNFGAASCTLSGSNGRVFAMRGDALIEVFGFSMNNVAKGASMLWAAGANATSFSIRARGVILNDAPAPDFTAPLPTPPAE
eukprot:m.174513 g.174513  ORF g.174513 m.174513 type:complete len:589 (-) comp13840_c0_seq1:78-1844(-)